MTMETRKLIDELFGVEFLPTQYRFNKSLLKDMHPYEIKDKDDKITIVLQAVGINKKDVNVYTKDNRKVLCVEGKTNNKDLDKQFDINIQFNISNPEKYEKIQKKVEDGLIYIHLIKKEVKEEQFDVEDI